MKRIALSLLIAGLLGLGGGARAAEDAAGDLDHLVCYKMKDPLSTPARFDLLARLQPEFSRAGCELVLDHDDEVRSEFCVPASKRNVVAPQHDPDLAGASLADDYVCYRIECPAAAKPPHKIVTDQFGSRHAGFGQPQRICVPATKEPFVCGQTGVNGKGAPMCGGVCPAGNRCQVNKATGQCGCAPVPCKGKSDSANVCGGACANPADACTAGDDNSCVCKPRGCGLDPATNQCGGACADPTQVCSETAAGCACAPPVTAGCGLDPEFGECSGPCPTGLFCLPPVAGGDFCLCRTFGGLE